MDTISIGVALGIRLGLVALFFPFSALDKILNFAGAVQQAQQVARSRFAAMGLIGAGFTIELFMPLGVVTGIADRACSLVLAGYCVATAVLWKQFWKPGDFWASSSGRGRTLFWDFLKNVALGAGFLLVTFGTKADSVASFFSHPLASSHPYHLHLDRL